jgi:hypothetical protein
MKLRIISVVALLLASANAQAALFSGPSAFSSLPFTQLGPITNNLTLTDTANGFFVSGQVIVSVPATSTPIGGILASWTVDRPLDPTYGTGNLITTTVLDGFSMPPVGLVGTTSGFVESHFTNYPISSQSFIPINLPGGAALWSNISVNSSTFSYTSGGVNFLRQRFEADGVYQSGPGGNWIVDVPVTTTATVIPEPSSIVLAGFGLAGLAAWARRRRTV